jgi:hypothetical protein
LIDTEGQKKAGDMVSTIGSKESKMIQMSFLTNPKRNQDDEDYNQNHSSVDFWILRLI